ncbi:PIN domain-containing protein [Chryseobacterium sp. ERMR1:04]|uniref:PIN domain-containing protein n=1 Tax=Chryseobacterium sp. ERMR1:04 TaxID=1705393 RepID=UPI0006C88A28|nr:PIN domain-containing protein [Chryseobacterium sp. ERMR1:04]KPH11683.1 hypothetical protein AMQ68_20105 [Chryseobacterium sp. ERMR1:04]
MKNIIIDTCVFVQENFFHGHKINGLLNLHDKEIAKIFITEITYHEVLKKFNDFFTEGLASYIKLKGAMGFKLLKNVNGYDNLFQDINKESVLNDFKRKLDKYISEGVIEIIPYKLLNIDTIFNDYFNGNPPFGQKNKKSEFPDAFTSKLIEEFIAEKGLSDVTIFSLDNDFSQLDSKATISKDYISFLNIENSKLEKAEVAERVYILNQESIIDQFKDWFEDRLYDYNLYHDAVNWKDIHDVEVEDINVDALEFSVVDITDKEVFAEITSNVSVKIDVTTDNEEFRYYDSDDKTYHFFDTDSVSLIKTFKCSMTIGIEVNNKEDYSEEYEIESINEGVEIYFDSIEDFY